MIEATEYSCFRTATLWSCIPESSGFLFSMSKSDKELQERWFEIYTSERSYNKTLKTLDLVLLNESKLILTFYDLNSVFILNETSKNPPKKNNKKHYPIDNSSCYVTKVAAIATRILTTSFIAQMYHKLKYYYKQNSVKTQILKNNLKKNNSK